MNCMNWSNRFFSLFGYSFKKYTPIYAGLVKSRFKGGYEVEGKSAHRKLIHSVYICVFKIIYSCFKDYIYFNPISLDNAAMGE